MSGDVAVVTGASRGIGLAVSRKLVERGLRVAMLSRTTGPLEEAAKSARTFGSNEVLAVPCDVTDKAQVVRAAEEILTKFGPPNLVVNNAGVVVRGHTIDDTPEDAWDTVLDVNLKGAFLVTQAFLPAMRSAKRGRFLFVGSISSTIGCAGVASYAAAKWGLVGFAKSLAEELRGSPLVSVALLPGSVDTDMLVGSGFDPKMTADDVANTLCYLGLDAPAAIHGSAIDMFG